MNVSPILLIVAATIAVLLYGLVVADDRIARSILAVGIVVAIGSGFILIQQQHQRSMQDYATCVNQAYADNVCNSRLPKQVEQYIECATSAAPYCGHYKD